MSGRFFYRAYDLAIRSELRLPELRRSDVVADVEIALGRVRRTPRGAGDIAMGVEVGEKSTWLFHPLAGAFRVCAGRRITVDPAPKVTRALLRLHLLGPVMGTLLRQRGRLTLHASAVAMQGGAVLFVGESGAGKSTMAAGLHARSCQLVADDIVSIDARGPRLLVFPGFPRLKLDARAAAAARITSQVELVGRVRRLDQPKGCFIADRGFDPRPLPLKSVYVLAEDAGQNSIEPLPPHEALRELLRHSYGARTLKSLNRETHFEQCATIARIVPVRRLTRRMALPELMSVADLIENDLANIA